MKKQLIIITSAALGIALAALYTFFILPTKIALVNFRDAQMAEVVMANDNWFIKPKQIDLVEDDFSTIVDYPVIYLSHVSTLTETQRNNLKIAMDNGSKVHVLMATSKENDLSNIAGEDLEYIKACFENDGEENIKRWLNYSRKVFDNRSLFTAEVTPAQTFPHDVFYRIGSKDFFEDVNQYWDYYKKANLYKEGKKTIAIINSSASPQTLFRSYQDSIIINMEQRGFNVVAIAGFGKRLENLKKLSPDLVMYFPHGRLNMMGGDEAIDWLKAQNIVLMTPQLVQQKYEDWIADQQGMAGGIFGQNIVVPELDGAIHPYAVAAEYMNEQGYHTYKPIPGRINRFCETAERWLSLKDKPNAEKKLSIYYYKGAGKNALVAGGLEVGESIFSLLNRLKAEGYNLGNMPADFDSFIKRIHKDGPLLGDYAKGTYEKFLAEGDPAYISVQEYEKWCKSELDPESYKEVLASYGPAPGKYMTTTKNDTAYLAIPRVQFGNISLLPVLPAAMDENEFKLAHGVKKAPPHAYIASYLWSRMAAKADVVAHFGAHGSVEFTPWKQVVLSLKDWPEALIAPVPHLYVYSVDNIGEAMMAKRRTYATMTSHLTPSYAQADLYGGLKDIANILHNFETMPDGALKETHRQKIKTFADTLDLEKDLGLTKKDLVAMNNETVEVLHNYVHHLETEKITIGLHTLGVQYSEKELNETVKMMTIDPLSQSLKQLAEINKGLPGAYDIHHHEHHGHGHNHHHHDDDYSDIAKNMVTEVLEKGKDPLSFLSAQDLARIEQLQNEYGAPEQTVISEYYGGTYLKKKERKEPVSVAKSDLVYDHKTHKMVPKSSLKDQKEELVYDRNTHKMVPKSSLKEQKEEMVYDRTTHKMVPKSSVTEKSPEEAAQGLALHLSATRKTAHGIEWLKNDKSFKEMSSLLDEETLHKFSNAGQMNEAVQQKVDLAKNEQYVKLLTYLQDSTKRVALLSWLGTESVQTRISSYREKLDAKVLDKVEQKDVLNDFLFAYKTEDEKFKKTTSTWNKEKLKTLKANTSFFIENKSLLAESKLDNNANLTAVQAIVQSNVALAKIMQKVAYIDHQLLNIASKEKQQLACLLQMKESLLSITEYKQNLIESPKAELDAFVNGMNGGFVAPSSGGDPISNPLSTPTGKNLYSINSEVTPTKEAFEIGQKMAAQILQKHIAKHGDYPKKIAYSLWGGEFIRNQGLNIGQIFYMLGVEPVRNQRGRVHDVKLIPMEQLKRPRIDVVVQTSGQFRDIAASRIYLINKAIEIASKANDEGEYKNYVKEGTALAEKQMKENGMSPEEARKFSTVRVFGGVNGHYGTGIMGLVEQGDKWETEQDIANTYIKNMGAMYSEDSWSQYREGMFETMLQNAEVVVHPRSSNVTGPISLDHVYEFMGGITASIRVTTGKDPDGYFNDFRNKYDPKAQGLKEAIWTETRTNLFNPKYIKAQMAEGESAAEGFAENFRDTYGWNVMKPDAIDKEIWEGYYDIYVKDNLKLGTVDFFKEKNPYALQEMTAVMLETIRKGYWKPSEAVTKDIANMHAQLVKDHQAGCSGFVCDNSKLKEMIQNLLGGELKTAYQQNISTVRTGSAEKQAEEGMVLKKEELQKIEVMEVLKDNLSTILLLIGIIGGAIVWGVFNRRKK